MTTIWWQQLVLVMCGGALGAAGRFWLGGALLRRLGDGFPWGTLVVNVSGDIVIGGLAGAAGLHVATVNRLLRGISIRTPRGTLPLRALAPRPVRPDGPAAEAVKQRLAELLRHAGEARPSDARLARVLAERRWPAAARMIDRVEWSEAEPVAVAAQRLARQDRNLTAGLRPAVATY